MDAVTSTARLAPASSWPDLRGAAPPRAPSPLAPPPGAAQPFAERFAARRLGSRARSATPPRAAAGPTRPPLPATHSSRLLAVAAGAGEPLPSPAAVAERLRQAAPWLPIELARKTHGHGAPALGPSRGGVSHLVSLALDGPAYRLLPTLRCGRYKKMRWARDEHDRDLLFEVVHVTPTRRGGPLAVSLLSFEELERDLLNRLVSSSPVCPTAAFVDEQSRIYLARPAWTIDFRLASTALRSMQVGHAHLGLLLLLREGAMALAAVHEAGLVHHDVKLDNFLYDEQQPSVLGDLTTARRPGVLGRPLLMGSNGYRAPETLTSALVAGATSADVFAFGLLALAMVNDAADELPPQVPPPPFFVVADSDEAEGPMARLLALKAAREGATSGLLQLQEFVAAKMPWPSKANNERFGALPRGKAELGRLHAALPKLVFSALLAPVPADRPSMQAVSAALLEQMPPGGALEQQGRRALRQAIERWQGPAAARRDRRLTQAPRRPGAPGPETHA